MQVPAPPVARQVCSSNANLRGRSGAARAYSLGMGPLRPYVVGVVALVVLGWAASAPAQDACARACRHMNVVSEREFKKELAPKLKKAERERMMKDSRAKEPERLAKCTTRCRAGRFDPKCVLRAKATLDYVACLTSGKGAVASAPAAGPGGKSRLSPTEREEVWKALAAANVKGKPVAAVERAKILKALDGTQPKYRLMLLGAALAESGAGMYGADLTAAFKALGEAAPEQAQLMILRDLTVPLAAMGCARPVADAMKLRREDQPAQLLATCPPPGKPRFFTVEKAGKTPLGPLLLALVLEHRARASGFPADPLHRRAVEILLQHR